MCFFFQRKTEHRLIFSRLLKPMFWLKFWYGWKDLVKSFPTSFFIIFYFLEFWFIYYDFSKFFEKMVFS